MIKYEAGGFGKEKIVSIEVERETANCIYINGRRCAKVGSYLSYFDTWQQAKDHLLQQRQDKIDDARRSLQYALDKLDDIKGLKNPDKNSESEK